MEKLNLKAEEKVPRVQQLRPERKQQPGTTVVVHQLESHDRLLGKLLLLIGMIVVFGFGYLHYNQRVLVAELESLKRQRQLDEPRVAIAAVEKQHRKANVEGPASRNSEDSLENTLQFQDGPVHLTRIDDEADHEQDWNREESSTFWGLSYVFQHFSLFRSAAKAPAKAPGRSRRDLSVRAQVSPSGNLPNVELSTDTTTDPNPTSGDELTRSPHHSFSCQDFSQCQTIVGFSEDISNLKKSTRQFQRNNAIHLQAYVNEEELARLLLEESEKAKGHFEDGAFVLKNAVFNIWKADEWYDKKSFRPHENSGKVKVKHAGVYLIYAQVVLYNPSARESVAVHVGDDVKPVVEHVFMQRVYDNKIKRSASDSDFYVWENGSHARVVEEYEEQQDQLILKPLTPPTRRISRHLDIYKQMSIVTVTHIAKDQTVFIRSMVPSHGVIVKGHLTFWGIAKL